MNSILRISLGILMPFSLYFSACADDSDLNQTQFTDNLVIRGTENSTIDKVSTATFSYADILERATASVVSVYTEKYETAYSNHMPNGIPELFRQFGFPVPDIYSKQNGNEADKRELRPYGAGSGVIMTDTGYIATNHHVVHDQRGNPVDKIRIRLADKREFEAELIGSDQKTDIAVLKVSISSVISPIIVSDGNPIRVGDVVFAIGNPLEVGITATQGIVSATGRHSLGILGQGAYENFIQTDASINLGNSGGALIDASGRLIGINTAIYSRSGGSIGIGFAIPINMVLDVMRKIVEVGEVPRGLLGLYSQDVTLDIAEAFGLDSIEGALVGEVQEGSPADEAGIKHGDVIVQINDIKIQSSHDLRLKVSRMSPGAKVIIRLFRDGELAEFPVTLGNIDDAYTKVRSGTREILEGVELKELDGIMRDRLSVPKQINGVLVSDVDAESPFARNIRPNTIIIEVNGQMVKQPSDVEDFLDPKEVNRFYIWYQGSVRYLVIRY